MIPHSDGNKTGQELNDDRSEGTNAKSVILLYVGCIIYEVLSQAEIEKYIAIGHIPLPKQFPNNLDIQCHDDNKILPMTNTCRSI